MAVDKEAVKRKANKMYNPPNRPLIQKLGTFTEEEQYRKNYDKIFGKRPIVKLSLGQVGRIK